MPGVAPQARHRGGVDDRAAAAVDHARHDVLHAQPHALEVDRDHAVEQLLRVLRERMHRALDARVVEEHVDAAEVLRRALDVALDLVGVPHVGLEGQYLGAGLAHRGRRHDESDRVEVDEHDARALAGESQRGRASDSTRAAGDQCRLALESPVHRVLRFFGARAFSGRSLLARRSLTNIGCSYSPRASRIALRPPARAPGARRRCAAPPRRSRCPRAPRGAAAPASSGRRA